MDPAALGGIGCVFLVAGAIVFALFMSGQVVFGFVAIFVLGFLLVAGLANL
jgi:hypothetical protein